MTSSKNDRITNEKELPLYHHHGVPGQQNETPYEDNTQHAGLDDLACDHADCFAKGDKWICSAILSDTSTTAVFLDKK